MREGALWPALAQYWHPVAFAEEVGEKPVSVRLLDERVAIFRLGGQVRAFHDLCIHRGTPISLGWIEGETVVCSYHGWGYHADGQCVRIPSLPPEHPIPKKARLTAYPAQERYGLVWVCLADEPRAPIPELPALEDPSHQLAIGDQRNWNCSAARAIENFVDFAHFAWVHEGILGDRDHPRMPDVNVERQGEELRFGFTNIPDRIHPVPHTRNYRLTRPFTIYQWKDEPDGRRETLTFLCTPISFNECTRFLLITRNYDLDPAKEDGTEKFLTLIAEQDRVIVENQRPEELPLDLTEELHLKGPDAVALAYRRFMRELGVEV
ncbi:MAG: Rieske 2Fe-2S domain-containing protein [Nitrospinota bacterium]